MSLAGEAIVTIWHDIADAGRDEFYWWHIHEHMPERVGIPGFLRGRRYIAEDGSPEFFTLYEAKAVDVLASQGYFDRLNNPTPWTLRTVKHIQNVARSIQHVHFSAGPGMGGYLLTMQFEVDDPDGFVETICSNVLSQITAVKGIAGVHMGETDLNTSQTKTREREQRGGETKTPGWSLLIEAPRRDELDQIRRQWLDQDRLVALGMAPGAETALYRLEYIYCHTENMA